METNFQCYFSRILIFSWYLLTLVKWCSELISWNFREDRVICPNVASKNSITRNHHEIHPKEMLVGGWTTQLKNMLAKLDHLLQSRDKKEKYLKPPPRNLSSGPNLTHPPRKRNTSSFIQTETMTSFAWLHCSSRRVKENLPGNQKRYVGSLANRFNMFQLIWTSIHQIGSFTFPSQTRVTKYKKMTTTA